MVKPAARGAKPRISRTSAATEPSWFNRTREIAESLMDRELFTVLPTLPNLRSARQQAIPSTSPGNLTAKMALRDRTKREADTAGASSQSTTNQTQSPPRKPRQTRTPSRTPVPSPPKQKQAPPPSRSKLTTPAQNMKPQSSIKPASSKPVSARAHRPPVPAEKNDLVSPTPKASAILPTGQSSAKPSSSNGVGDNQQRPLTIRIKLPARAKTSQEVPQQTSETTLPIAPFTDAA